MERVEVINALRPEDIESLGRLLDRDVEFHPHVLSIWEVRRWMDADERFAAYVREHQPDIAVRADLVITREAMEG